jgi:protein-tyrosine-phosphatase
MPCAKLLPSGQTDLDRALVDPTDPLLDIEDPIGKDPRTFDAVTRDIELAIARLVDWIPTALSQGVSMNSNRREQIAD